jgi:hypothetical protein
MKTGSAPIERASKSVGIYDFCRLYGVLLVLSKMMGGCCFWCEEREVEKDGGAGRF